MIRVTKEGAFMDCYNANEVARAESKGWTVVEKKVEVEPLEDAKKPRRMVNKRAKK